MNRDDTPPSLDDLDAKLREARSKRPVGSRGKEREGGWGLGFKIGVELVSALAVGVGIGLLLDYWLGTKPWMLLLFFVLGAAAGILNVYRTVSGYGYAVGYRRPRAGKGRDDEEQSGGPKRPGGSGEE
jgi:ATP synthase protein I